MCQGRTYLSPSSFTKSLVAIRLSAFEIFLSLVYDELIEDELNIS